LAFSSSAQQTNLGHGCKDRCEGRSNQQGLSGKRPAIVPVLARRYDVP
jgi:hypothetical protein